MEYQEKIKMNIQAAIKESDGNMSKAADLCNISRKVLYEKIKIYNIDTKEFNE